MGKDPETINSVSKGEILCKEQKILVAYFSWADNTEQDNIDATTSASVTVPGNVFDAYEEDTVDSMEAIREWLKEIGYFAPKG